MVNRLDLDTSLSLEEPDLAPMSPRTDCGSAECNETIQHHASELVKMRAERDQLPLDVGVLRSRVRQLLHSSKRSSTSTRGEYQEEIKEHKTNKTFGEAQMFLIKEEFTCLERWLAIEKKPTWKYVCKRKACLRLLSFISLQFLKVWNSDVCVTWNSDHSEVVEVRAMVSQNLHQGPEGEREQPHEGEDDEEMGGGSSSSTDSKATPVMYQESGDSSSSSLSEEEQQQPEETPKKRRTDDHLQGGHQCNQSHSTI
ncbi:hypothetical protein F2P81_007473 [Scophthalmus maximus]|uniref:Uncharacterized protein n=1 Tax=Scophthalmus maximus TaxID=52904 RepID=A0A6A4T4H1_SCOMX|nr:hypothetical protein F2P81_007473 [Scophthalmus maximus]